MDLEALLGAAHAKSDDAPVLTKHKFHLVVGGWVVVHLVKYRHLFIFDYLALVSDLPQGQEPFYNGVVSILGLHEDILLAILLDRPFRIILQAMFDINWLRVTGRIWLDNCVLVEVVLFGAMEHFRLIFEGAEWVHFALCVFVRAQIVPVVMRLLAWLVSLLLLVQHLPVVTFLLVEDRLESNQMLFVDEHHILDLLNGIGHRLLSPVNVSLHQLLEIDGLCFSFCLLGES